MSVTKDSRKARSVGTLRRFPGVARVWAPLRSVGSNGAGPLSDQSQERGSDASDTGKKDRSLLTIAEDELVEYIELLGEHEASEDCKAAYEYLKQARTAAELAAVARGPEGAHPEQLQQLELLVRELLSRGDVRDVVRSLATLARLERKASGQSLGSASSSARASRASTEDTGPGAAFPGLPPTDRPHRREQLVEMFQKMDSQGHGVIDAGQFRAAMRDLGDDLNGEATAIIFDAMDIHGFINLEQFIAIVEAEEVRSHSTVATMLHRLHMHPTWWTENPLDNVM